MEKFMKKAEKQFMAAVFTEVLPAALQQEMEEKGYKVKVCKKHVKVSSECFYRAVSTQYEGPTALMEKFLDKYCSGDIDKTSPEYLNLFRKAVITAGVTVNPVTRDLVVRDDTDRDYNEITSWLNTYVEYRVPLDNQDISGIIRAAKEFAGLE